jgi:hypothetical protein
VNSRRRCNIGVPSRASDDEPLALLGNVALQAGQTFSKRTSERVTAAVFDRSADGGQGDYIGWRATDLNAAQGRQGAILYIRASGSIRPCNQYHRRCRS